MSKNNYCPPSPEVDDPSITIPPPVKGLRSSNPFKDDCMETCIANIKDDISNAWKCWEQACWLKDDGIQDYYMRMITILLDTIRKLKKV